jgi:hypothetical protein
MGVRQVGAPDAIIPSSRHVGHVVIWLAANRFFALAIDVAPDAELVAQAAQDRMCHPSLTARTRRRRSER